MQILLFNLAALLATTSQGLTGFGGGTLMVSTLVLIYPFRDVVPVVAAAALATNIVMMLVAAREMDWRRGPVAAAGLTLGIVAGAQLLTVLPVAVLQKTLGIILLAYVALNLWKTPVPQTMPRLSSVDGLGLGASALVSGVIVGAVGVAPIPLLIYVNLRYPKQFSRSILTIAFLVGSVAQVVIYLYLGLLDADNYWLALACLPAILIGLALGNRLHHRIDQKSFSRILALILLLPALRLVLA